MPQIEIPDMTVNEDVGEIEIDIRRVGGDLSMSSTIIVTSQDGTAIGTNNFAYL